MLSIFGIDPTWELAGISLAYFCEGASAVSRLAIKFFVKDALRASPAALDLLHAVHIFPWAVKPIYGFISDSFYLFGYKRCSYIQLCGLVGALVWLALAVLPPRMATTVCCVLLEAISTAFSNVVVGSLVVERQRGESLATTAALQSLAWSSKSLGAVLSAYGSGLLLHLYGPVAVFRATAILPLLSALSSFLIPERRRLADRHHDRAERNRAGRERGGATPPKQVPPGRRLPRPGTARGPDGTPIADHRADSAAATAAGTALPPAAAWDLLGEVEGRPLLGEDAGALEADGVTLASRLRLFRKTIGTPEILFPAFFLFLWQSVPNPESALFYFYTSGLGFSPEFMGRVAMIAALFNLLGIILYNKVGLQI